MKTHPPGQQQAGTVRCRVVGEANLQPVMRQLVSIGGTQHLVTLYLGINDLQGEREVGGWEGTNESIEVLYDINY